MTYGELLGLDTRFRGKVRHRIHRGREMNWTSGYVSEIDYTYGYYGELNPAYRRPQHFLCFLPLPHGQGELGPILGSELTIVVVTGGSGSNCGSSSG